MKDVRGKTAVVTGGASGIGLAMCQRFAQEGMKVVMADVVADRVDESEALLRDQGLEVTGVRTDVTDLASVEALAERTLELYGGVHVLCNNAGISPGGQIDLWDYEPTDWQWTIDVNVYGVAWGIRTFVPIMISQDTECHVVNTSSGNGGIAPMAVTPIYSVTKAAVVTMTETLYMQLRIHDTKIGASVLFPGPGMLRTRLNQSYTIRPERYASEATANSPHTPFDELLAKMRKAGIDAKETPLEEVADFVMNGIWEDRFWLLPDAAGSNDTLTKRYESMRDRRNPDYFRQLPDLRQPAAKD